VTWLWDQSAGELSHDGKLISKGYSGAGRGKNNPIMQDAQGVGPIPRGLWTMTGVKDSPNTGPFTIVLEPKPGTDARGRSAFRVHGDSIASPGTASHGCIILPRAIRQAMWSSGDRDLAVAE
jgi:hypothetical protein